MQSGYIHLTEYQSGQLLNTHEKKHDCLTAVLQKWRFSASYDSFVVGSSLVLRLKFSGKNRHLRKAAKRYRQSYPNTTKNEYKINRCTFFNHILFL